MLATANRLPECFGRSYFVPGEAVCGAVCRTADRCRETYLDHARATLAADPGALVAEERLYVLASAAQTSAEAGRALVALPPPTEEPTEPSRKLPERWSDTRRRPLESFKPASVPALAVEVLRAAGRRLHAPGVPARVLPLAAARGVRLGGKTPQATVGLALRQVRGVELVGRGMYTWIG